MGKWTESDSVAEEGVSSSEVSGPSTKPVKMLEIPDISKRKMAPVVAKREGLAEPMIVEKPLLAFSKAFLVNYSRPFPPVALYFTEPLFYSPISSKTSFIKYE